MLRMTTLSEVLTDHDNIVARCGVIKDSSDKIVGYSVDEGSMRMMRAQLERITRQLGHMETDYSNLLAEYKRIK